MKLFSVTRTLATSLSLALALFAASVCAQVPVSVVGNSNAACANASVTFSSAGIAITLPAGCGGAAATAPAITAFAPSATGTVATAYPSYTFVASGSPTPTWAATGLPPGLGISGSGVLSGTPTTAGTYSSVNVTASNSAGTDSKILTITIAAASGPPVITNAALNLNVVTNVLFTPFTYTASGSQTGLQWTVSTGALPVGLTLDPNTGVVSGTPTVPATYNFTIQAANGTLPNSTQAGQITVATPTAPVLGNASPPTTATVGVAYPGYTFTTTAGNPTPTWTVATGALPAGMSLSGAGVLSGTPTTAGAATFTVKAANGTTPDAISPSITITVAGGAACPADTSLDDGCIPNPSKNPNTIPVRTAGKLSGAGIGAYATAVTSCANANAQLGANAGVTRSWQHNIDMKAYRDAQGLDYFQMGAGEALSFRMVVPALGLTSSFGQIQVAESSVIHYAPTMISVSSAPCDFDVTKLSSPRDYCYASATTSTQINFEIKATGPATYVGYCALRPGSTYYFNVRFLNAVPPGALTADSCTASGNSSCGGVLQIR